MLRKRKRGQQAKVAVRKRGQQAKVAVGLGQGLGSIVMEAELRQRKRGQQATGNSSMQNKLKKLFIINNLLFFKQCSLLKTSIII